jgi:hypothetical protein
MSKLAVLQTLTRTAHKLAFKTKKHSPEILVVAGVVGAVTSGVMACRATLKVVPVLNEAKENITTLKTAMENPEMIPEGCTVEDCQNDMKIVCAQTTLKVVKSYAPAVILGALSITAILTSSHIMRKRNLALAAAYTAVDKGWKEYRNRVKERFGSELEKEILFNLKEKEVEEVVVNEDGSEHVVKKTVTVSDADPNMPSVYARFFDCGCPDWEKDPEFNLMFLRRQQDYANELLRCRGHVFLNEVYDMLGIQRSSAGAQVGWVVDGDDGYIDFGIYNQNSEKARDFVNGYERTILLDFNVDGYIIDRI